MALVPAAGLSRRMGRPKLALPLGSGTVLGAVVAALREGGTAHVLVVTGPHVPELGPLAQAAGAEVYPLAEPTADMRATVAHGLRRLEERFRPRDEDAWLLVPADHPTLEPAVVRQLIQGRRENPRCSIWVPTYQGRRGHPVMIAWKHARGIEASPPDQGINQYLRRHAAECLEVALDEPSVLWDLDVPEDYERLCRAWRTRNSTVGALGGKLASRG
jgi:molybdenum cofactor cytidylyltransferase